MNITKVNPFFQGKSITNIIDDVFNRSISDFVGNDFAVSNPSVNISELDDRFVLELAAPGLEKKDFSIAIDKGQLTISASKEAKTEENEAGKWTRKEFNFNAFKRSFHITDAVDAEKIVAEYQNGILTVALPKKEEAKAKEPKTIEIK
jgi:HSP20 family protein